MSHLIPYRPNMLGGIPNPFSRMGNYFSRPRSQLGGHRGLPRHLSYDTCYDCEITAGQHVCQSCLASQYGYEHYSCACSLCDFCDDGYGGGYSNMGGRGGGYGGGLYYDPRMDYTPRNRMMNFGNMFNGFNNWWGGMRGGNFGRRRLANNVWI